jgi:hypothetical protein
MRPRLYHWRELHAVARDHGLSMVAREHVFVHDVLLAWEMLI